MENTVILRKKSKRGITLVEVVCVLAIMGVVGVLVSNLLLTATQQYQAILRANKAKVSVTVMEEYFNGQLRYVKGNFTYQNAPPNANQAYYYCDGKRLYHHPANGADTDIFAGSPDYYSADNYGLSFFAGENNTVLLDFWAGKGDMLSSGAKTYYTSSYAVHLLRGTATGAADTAYKYLVYQSN